MSDLTVPDTSEPFTAYRWYGVDILTGHIFGAMGTRWRRPEMEAQCLADCSVAPSDGRNGCAGKYTQGCGIYSYKSFDSAFADGLRNATYTSMLLAECLLWGKVYEHEWGYRAQFVRVINMWTNIEPRATGINQA